MSPAHSAALFSPATSTSDRSAPPDVPPHGTPRTAALRLPDTGRECAQARDFTDRALDVWQLDHCRDDALSIVSELVANAVVHARPGNPVGEAELEVWLRLTLRSDHLVCAVTDPASTLPACPRRTDQLQEHGRGLHIVEALSAHWGWTRSAPTGKTVWAMLPTRRTALPNGTATP
ncbi:ATP-binding protein [Streptomyces sp. NPDC001401]|uniref:ATP-binding protein n=1 Tax=Streptomyces sp. NPDC001401 TaxID=3364570 RepID=UPI0036847CC3